MKFLFFVTLMFFVISCQDKNLVANNETLSEINAEATKEPDCDKKPEEVVIPKPESAPAESTESFSLGTGGCTLDEK